MIRTLIIIYSIFLSTLQCTAQSEYLIHIDPTNGTVKKIAHIPNVGWIRTVGNWTYNRDDQEYSFMGFKDDIYKSRLYTIDAISGSIIDSPLLTFGRNDNPANFAYDPNSKYIYGIYWSDSQEREHFVKVNRLTGTFDSLTYFPDVKWIKPGTQCINPKANTYTFLGLDSNLVQKFYTVDLSKLTISTSSTLKGTDTMGIYEMKYDYVKDRYIATLIRNSDWLFAEVDIHTAGVKGICSLPEFNTLKYTQTCMSSISGQYYIGLLNNNDKREQLSSIDLTNGKIISSHYLESKHEKDNLICFEYDDKIDQIVALYWEEVTDNREIKVYPTPFTDKIHIDFARAYPDQSIALFNMNGQLIKMQRLPETMNTVVYSGDIPAGAYILTIFRNNSLLFRSKIIRQ